MTRKACPECGSTRVVSISKAHGTSKCKSCGYKGDSSEFEVRR